MYEGERVGNAWSGKQGGLDAREGCARVFDRDLWCMACVTVQVQHVHGYRGGAPLCVIMILPLIYF